jgi:acyl carrier protein
MTGPDETRRGTIAARVATVWCDLFKRDAIASRDHFFELGGNSLAAVKFLAEIELSFGFDALTPEQLYRSPMFDEVVTTIEANVGG